MTERVAAFKAFLEKREYQAEICRGSEPVPPTHTDDEATVAERFCQLLKRQTPKIYPLDRFGFNYTYIRALGKGRGGNTTPDYEGMLGEGFDGIRRRIEAAKETVGAEGREFLEAGEKCIAGVLDLCERYRLYAEKTGHQQLAAALRQVPAKGARTLYEALVTLKIVQFTLRLADVDHVGWGRMDQYLYPYYLKEQNREAALELIEEFFISINLDTYLYFGIQQGDNGQSLMLGSPFNELSFIILDASAELCLIDPKINVRVDKNTPIEIYRRCTDLTKKGLGFPQYCNDDVVIPALKKLGYAPKDAEDYTVAACWEFIIPAKSADLPNRGNMVFPRVVREVMVEHLADCKSAKELYEYVEAAIAAESAVQIEKGKSRYHFTLSPYLSMLIRPCIERGLDFARRGALYHNMGFHGVGISDAAGALYAAIRAVFEERIVTAEELIDALEKNFEGYEELRRTLRAYPKMGDNEDAVDSVAAFLMQSYSKHMNGVSDGVGGTCRAGTGSAMEYLRCAKDLGATAEGRGANEPFSCSFSPALGFSTRGPLSVIASFTKHPMVDICNGGPLTMELHHNIFRNPDGEEKVARLVQRFIARGGHQLQLNAVDPTRLQAALEHPEQHRDLIVRVWGWSGRFVELDPEYQQHILARAHYQI